MVQKKKAPLSAGSKRDTETPGLSVDLICVNGPPRSGKDTVAGIIQHELSDWENYPERGEAVEPRIDKFAAPLDRIAQAVLGCDDQEYRVLREEKKDEKLDGYDCTMRDLLIAISEVLLKPLFGDDYFAVQALKRLTPDDDIVIYSDSGFQVEFDRVKAEIAEHPLSNICLVRTHRKGTTFKGDSRHRVEADGAIDITNDEDIEALTNRVIEKVLIGDEV